MKKIGAYRYDEKTYNEVSKLLNNLSIQIVKLEDGKVEDEIELYLFNIDSVNDLTGFDFNKPFIIISSVNNSGLLRKSNKLGALDFIFKPFVDVEATVKRIQRALQGNEDKTSKLDQNKQSNNDKLIDIELKRAHRGKYPFALLKIDFEQKLNTEIVIKLIDKIKLSLRESDSCLIYPNDNIIIMLPFADAEGTVVVARKIFNLLNNLGYKGYCLGAQCPEEGESREELFDNFGKSIDTRNLYK